MKRGDVVIAPFPFQGRMTQHGSNRQETAGCPGVTDAPVD